jgi:hypothetical protein
MKSSGRSQQDRGASVFYLQLILVFLPPLQDLSWPPSWPKCSLKNGGIKPGMVAHTCNPGYSRDGDQEDQTAWANSYYV